MNAKELIKKAKEQGWEIKRQSGSHVKLKKGNSTTIIPYHGSKDIPVGTLNQIFKQLGLK
ncbi:type II toxin-antitoxin system HicA family toxin [Clostridium botulinum]|nr:type II toxin-antitoxin system HicA family toxin [Clostridium botulinum]NFA17719.1 type II toxin-antitoxin system HicA family toxin [Clostridium botulinum]NFA54321.1 type II toxin-antitoxin system HicA family toxin [Clostridium botulinum]NFA67863.1 type II toxin-antitoxin system HicA family toxin [Clostridium botulinum]NFE16997.1 type II toxin-antitoxin system HicA family toxin [Clostridium botulinum]